MKYRKLRIAWSVAWGVVAVLLCVLWVRNQWTLDKGGGPLSDKKYMYLAAFPGGGGIRVIENPGGSKLLQTWTVWREPTEKVLDVFEARFHERPSTIWGEFGYTPTMGFALVLPYWFMIVVVAGLSAIPWLRFRFSLRTLLIATTLVAVGLGTIIALSR